MKVKEWLKTCNRTSIYLEVWDTDDTIDIPHFVGYSSELQNSQKYRRVLNANLDFWDFDYESANEPVNYYFKLIVSGLKNESKSRKSSRKLGIRESYDDYVDGYAVKLHDYGKGYIHLLLFEDKYDAEDIYTQLESLSDGAEMLDDEEFDIEVFNDEVSSVIDKADEVVTEIDERREVDKNGIWTAVDDTKYQIINDVPVVLWLYW